jgi:hypothetical protein
MDSHSFSVVIVAGNDSPTVEECLRCAIDQTRRPDQIVLVDEGSSDVEELRRLVEEAGLRWTRVQGGRLDANRARNLGIQAAINPIVALIDHDVAVERDGFESLVGLLEQFGAHGVVGATARPSPREAPPEPSYIRHAFEERFRMRSTWCPGLMQSSGFCLDIEDGDALGPEPFDVDFPCRGLAVYVRDVCLAEPFPEGLGLLASGSEKFFGVRLTRRRRILLDPRAKARRLSPQAGSAPTFRHGLRRIAGAYWISRQFVKGRPFAFPMFLWAGCGSVAIEIARAIGERRPARLAEAAGQLAGLAKALAWRLSFASLPRVVQRAAARRGQPIEEPVGLGPPLRIEPLEAAVKDAGTR